MYFTKSLGSKVFFSLYFDKLERAVQFWEADLHARKPTGLAEVPTVFNG